MSPKQTISPEVRARREQMARAIEGKDRPQASQGGEGAPRAGGWKNWPWATLGFIAVWLAYFTLLKQSPDTARAFHETMRFDLEKVRAGEWERLFAASFLHREWMDIIFNVWFFFTAGKLTENFFGKWHLAAVWILASLGGGLGLLYTGYNHDLLSTGATFGVIGALMGSYFRYKKQLAGVPRGVFFGFVPLLAIYLLMLYVGYAPFVMGEFFGGMAAGFLAPFILPAAGDMRQGPKKPLVAPVFVTSVVLLSGAQIGRHAWQATQPILHQGSAWTVEIPAGAQANVSPDESLFTVPGSNATYAVTRARKLISANLEKIRDDFRKDFGLRKKRKEKTFEDLPLGKGGETWVYMLAEERDGSRSFAYAASEESAATRGIFLWASAPADEEERMVENFLRMIATFELDK